MTGLLFGLEETGIDVRHPGSMIGSSAGALLGARLGTGLSLQTFYELETSIEEQSRQTARFRELFSARPNSVSNHASSPLLDIFSREWSTEEERVQAICRLARETKTASWETFEAIGIPPESRSALWPTIPLQIGVIDVDGCCLTTLNALSGVSVSVAILASCSIPGLFPPVPIAGRRYTDGGSWGSGDNAHLATGARSVLVISPMAAQRERNAAILSRDVADLRTQGARVHSIVADKASLATRGTGAPNPASMKAAAEAGRAQARQETDGLKRKFG